MSTRAAPPLVDHEDLVDAGNKIIQLANARGAFNVSSSLGLASVHLLGAAHVSSQLLPHLTEVVRQDGGTNDHDLIGVVFGVGLALGALAAQQAAARASGQEQGR